MPRSPKLRVKNGYWFTKAGGTSGTYFGRVDEITHNRARELFAIHLKNLSATRSPQRHALTVAMLCDEYLEWLKNHRSERTYEERRRHLKLFCNHRVGSQRMAELIATDVQDTDLQSFLTHVQQEHALDPFTVDKYATSVKAAYTWGRKHPAPTSYLPNSYHPFSTIEKYKRPDDSLSEAELVGPDELEALLKWADADLATVRENGTIRSRRPEEYRQEEANPYRGFRELLEVYWHTGARTSELAKARVGDFMRHSGMIVLRTHKRQMTMKNPVSRRIQLTGRALAIVEQRCEGRKANDPIFTDPKGRAWNRYRLDYRFKKVRELAGVRDEITIYSFRHTWISRMVLGHVNIAVIAKMAGTSISMIEKVYGHFNGEDFKAALRTMEEAEARRIQQKRSA